MSFAYFVFRLCYGIFHSHYKLSFYAKEIGSLSCVSQIHFSTEGPGQPWRRNGTRQAQYNSVGSGCGCVEKGCLSHISSCPPDVIKLLPSNSQQISNEDLTRVSARKRVHWTVSMETAPPTAFTIQKLLQAFMYNKLAKEDLQTHNHNFECTLKVFRGIKNACGFCRAITRGKLSSIPASAEDNWSKH